jgi:RNA-directed DNA polymerase
MPKGGETDRPWNRKFLGFSFTRRRNRCVSEKAVKAFKERVRILTRRTRGRRIKRIVEDLRRYMIGWRAYFGFSEVALPARYFASLGLPRLFVKPT